MSKKPFFGPDKLREVRKNRFWMLVTASPMLVALLVFFLFARPANLAFVDGLSLFLAGVSGVIIMIRREEPTSLYKVTGWPAVLRGAIFTAFCWGIGLYVYLSSITGPR